MPNHVTNKVTAPAEVLRSLLNESGAIDFNTLLPFKGSFEWNGINGGAEEAAALVCGNVLDDHPLIASLQKSNRARTDILKLDDECFEQFVQMLRNKRATGHFHTLDFARDAWGTKWNAYDQSIDLDAGELSFDTAWSCPIPVLVALSTKHPEAEIVVRFADEDIGCNCGTITLTGGAVVSTDQAGRWHEMTKEDQDKWRAFALDLTGRSDETDEDA